MDVTFGCPACVVMRLAATTTNSPVPQDALNAKNCNAP